MSLDDHATLSRLAHSLPRPLARDIAPVLAFTGHVREIVQHARGDPLAQLNRLRLDLDAIAAGTCPAPPPCAALASVIERRSLPLEPLRDLLVAACDDLTTARYGSFGELMVHARRAANPIGRLVLHLCNAASPRHLALSDGLCCGLWLTCMLRDVPGDFEQGRLYLPLEDLARYRVVETQIAARQASGGWRALMMFEIERARKMLQAGAPLGRILQGRVGFDARLLVVGGERVQQKLHEMQGDVFTRRPEIDKRDWPYLLGRALIPSYRP
jgi:squalene synthase HpnC